MKTRPLLSLTTLSFLSFLTSISSARIWSAHPGAVRESINAAFAADSVVVDFPIKKLYQNDYPQKMDHSNDTIADQGCTLTAWTMLINYELERQGIHKRNADGSEGPILSYTPQELNVLLTDYRYIQRYWKRDAQGQYLRDKDGELIEDTTRQEVRNGWDEKYVDGQPVAPSANMNFKALLEAVEKDVKSRSKGNVDLVTVAYAASGWGREPAIGANGVVLDQNYQVVLFNLNLGPVLVRTADNKHSVLVKSFHQETGQPAGKGRYDIADPARRKDGTSVEYLDHPDYGNRIFHWGAAVFAKGGVREPYQVPSDAWIDSVLIHDPQANPNQYGPQLLIPSYPYEAIGHALDFGGTDSYVTFGVAPSLGLGQFTLECWFRRDASGAPANTGTGGLLAEPLVSKGCAEADGNNTDMNYFLGVRSPAGVIAADFEEGAGGQYPGRNHPVVGVTPIQNGTWYHAAVTYDGTTLRLYLNGQLENAQDVGQPPRSDSIQHAALASALNSSGMASGFFNGAIDEVRIWNHARTQAEIQSTINSMSLPQSGLVERWSLNEGAGTTVTGVMEPPVAGTIHGGNWAWTYGSPFKIVIDNPPAEPLPGSPANGGTGVALSPSLVATLSDPDADVMSATYYGRPVVAAPPRPFSFVIIPDTQNYTASLSGGSPATFRAQTGWIVSKKDSLNVVLVDHVGDCVTHGDSYPAEWDGAWSAMSLLEDPVTTGLPDGLTYVMTVGSHDQSPTGDPTGTTIGFNEYFGESHFAGRPYYGNHYGLNNDNYFIVFHAGGLDFIVLSLEYDASPDASVLAWAHEVLSAYSNCRALVSATNLIGWGNPPGFTQQGQAIYDALKDNPNLFLMISGGIPGEGHRSDTYNGRTVHTVMADFENRQHGGDGWLRIMKVYPAENVIRVTTYSPTLHETEADPDSSSQFTLPIDLAGSQSPGQWQMIGTVTDVPSGSNSEIVWPGLAPFTEYEWYVTASDGASSSTSPVWRFTTGSQPPAVQVNYPNGGEAFAVGDAFTVRWTATDDVGVMGVDVMLSRNGVAGTYEAVAAGVTNTGEFRWIVTGPGTHDAFLKVIAYDQDGHTGGDVTDAAFTILAPTGVATGRVTKFALDVVGSNPFGQAGRFSLAVPRPSRVRVTIYDVLGRRVAIVADQVFRSGRYPLVWNGDTQWGKAASGVYFVKMETPGKVITRKVVLVR